jgi:hypothetical protein
MRLQQTSPRVIKSAPQNKKNNSKRTSKKPHITIQLPSSFYLMLLNLYITTLRKPGAQKQGMYKANLFKNNQLNVSDTKDAVLLKNFFLKALASMLPVTNIVGTTGPGGPNGPNQLNQFIVLFSLAIVEREQTINNDTLNSYVDSFDYLLTKKTVDNFNAAVDPILNTAKLEKIKFTESHFKILKDNIKDTFKLNKFKQDLKNSIKNLLSANSKCDLNAIGFEKSCDKTLSDSLNKKIKDNNHKTNKKDAFYSSTKDKNWILSGNRSNHQTAPFKLFHLQHGYIGECNGFSMTAHSPGKYFKEKVKVYNSNLDIKEAIFIIPNTFLHSLFTF